MLLIIYQLSGINVGVFITVAAVTAVATVAADGTAATVLL